MAQGLQQLIRSENWGMTGAQLPVSVVVKYEFNTIL